MSEGANAHLALTSKVQRTPPHSASPSNRKRPKGFAARIADSKIPEEVRDKMPHQVRVEVCNWFTSMCNFQSQHGGMEQSLVGKWAHWGPCPTKDSSGQETTLWRQAYILPVAGNTTKRDMHVCSLVKLPHGQLHPRSTQVKFGPMLEQKWASIVFAQGSPHLSRHTS